MLTVDQSYDPENDVVVDVGITSDQYQRWYNSPPIANARKAQATVTAARVTRVREVSILAGAFLALFALERILGRQFGVQGSISGAAVTTAAKAAAGGV